MPVPSFDIDHRTLTPRVRIAKKKQYGDTMVTVFDLRLRKPNTEAIPTDAMHSLEHLLATILRNDPETDKRLIDISPMGCRTGFYAGFFGDLEVADIIPVLQKAFEEVVAFEGDVPGATEMECGFYRDHNLAGAQKEAKMFLENVLKKASE